MGDYNHNQISIEPTKYSQIEKELNQLIEYLEKKNEQEDKQMILFALSFCKEEAPSKIRQCLKQLSKKTIELIPQLGLTMLQMLMK